MAKVDMLGRGEIVGFACHDPVCRHRFRFPDFLGFRGDFTAALQALQGSLVDPLVLTMPLVRTLLI